MDKKFLYALTTNVFNTLKKLGIKPKLGITTKVTRLPGTKNSLNTDLSKLEEVSPEGLKRLITNDSNFLPQASQDELVQFNNNLEYLQATYPEVFKKAETAINAKTGVKTLVDNVDDVETTTIDREPKADGGLMIGVGTMFRKRGR